MDVYKEHFMVGWKAEEDEEPMSPKLEGGIKPRNSHIHVALLAASCACDSLMLLTYE